MRQSKITNWEKTSPQDDDAVECYGEEAKSASSSDASLEAFIANLIVQSHQSQSVLVGLVLISRGWEYGNAADVRVVFLNDPGGEEEVHREGIMQ